MTTNNPTPHKSIDGAVWECSRCGAPVAPAGNFSVPASLVCAHSAGCDSLVFRPIADAVTV